MLKVSELTLAYSRKEVLSKLSFQGKRGEIMGVLGKNGVGKSTLLQALVGLKKIDSGTIELSSTNIGYVPEQQGIYDYLTGNELLEVVADLKNIPSFQVQNLQQELSAYMKLPDLSVLVSHYSKGNREKLIFLLALLGHPNILVLDEPFTGFDPESVLGAEKFLLKYSMNGNFLILSTHVLEIAAQLCHRVLVLLEKDKSIMLDFQQERNINKRLENLASYFGDVK